jgi:transcriptional regulator with XRE-family HTH domain
MKKQRLRKPSQPMAQILANNIRSFRKANKLSQEDLADKCDLHRTYVGSVERGERNVTLSTLEVFADAFGIGVPELLTQGATGNARK